MPVVVLIGAGMVSISWQKWCDPIIDFGRELYIPWVLTQGKVLYKDISMFFYGPLSFYVNALLFSIFGTHIDIIITFNLVLITIVSCIIFKLVTTVSNPVCALFSVLSFLILFAFPRYFPTCNDNFVTPYAHVATHGMALSFLAFLFLSLYLKTRKTAYACACWFTLGLVMLTKVEIFLGLFCSMVLSWAWILRREQPKAHITAARCMMFVSLLMLPLSAACAFFSRFFTVKESLLHVLNPYLLTFHRGHSFSSLLIHVMGADQPWMNTRRMLWWLSIYALMALLIAGLNHVLTAFGKKTGYKALPPALALLITVPLINATMAGGLPYFDYFLPLPLIVLLHMFYAILKLRRSGVDDIAWGKHLLGLSLSVFSFVLLTRLFFNARIVHYGFFLLLPGFLILLIVLLDAFPVLMRRITGEARIGMILVMTVLVCVMYSYFFQSFGLYSLMDYPIKSNGEVMKSFDLRHADTGQVIQHTIDQIKVNVEPHQTLTVFPEGLMFNYLTRRQSGSAYTAFLPTFFAVFKDAILGSLQERPPDFVLLVERSTWEYGYEYFGVDYAHEVFQWIQENYIQISQIGKTPFSGEGFGIIFMKRLSNISHL